MSLAIKIEEENTIEQNILTSAFHANVENFFHAEEILKGAKPGSFITYSIKEQNFCSAVARDGRVMHNGFRFHTAGYWQNYGLKTYKTYLDLLDHLVDGQEPLPVHSA